MNIENPELSRRTLVKGAAWSLPVIAVAAATPMAAASTGVVEGVAINGDCAVLGLLLPGFTVDAPTDAIPAGSTLTIAFDGLLNVDVLQFGLNGGLAGVATINVVGGNQVVNFTQDFTGSGSLRALLAVTLAGTITATLTLPTGSTAGATSKLVGELDYTSGIAGLLSCADN